MCLGLILSHLKNLRIFNFQALDVKFVLALEPRVLKLVRKEKNSGVLTNHPNKKNDLQRIKHLSDCLSFEV